MSSPMLVFDSDCAFCDRAVRFILAHERRHDLLFVPRRSPLGRRLREEHRLQQVESLLWIEDGRAFIEWDSVARVCVYLGGIYAQLARIAGLLPSAQLNAAYRFIARVRKRLAGPPRRCLILTPEQQARFIA